MRHGTFISQHTVHQIEQAPVVADMGYDGSELSQDDTVTGSRVMRWYQYPYQDTFEHWLHRMEFVAGWRKAVSSSKKLKGE